MVVISDSADNWRTAAEARDRPAPAARLFCFPHAGGSYVAFSGWCRRLPAGVDVVSVCAAGRLRRLREAPLRTLEAHIDELHDLLAPLLDAPFALFGHSLGALAAFELARRLRRTRGPQPSMLFASGRGAPQVRPATPDLHRLPADALIAELRTLEGLPPGLDSSSELIALVLPSLRADLEMHECYVYEAEPPLSMPIVALTGADDPQVTMAEVEAWREQTSSSFVCETYPGGHFFTVAARDAALASVSRHLHAAFGQPAARAAVPAAAPAAIN